MPVEALQPLEDILSSGLQTLPPYADYNNLPPDNNTSPYSNQQAIQKADLSQDLWSNPPQHASVFDFQAQDASTGQVAAASNYEFGLPRCMHFHHI